MISVIRSLPENKSKHRFPAVKACRRIYLFICSVVLLRFFSSCRAAVALTVDDSENDYVKISAYLVTVLKKGAAPAAELDLIKTVNQEELEKQLYDDARKKAFWLNLYNAFVQVQMQAALSRYHNKRAFFKDRVFVVAGHAISLDDIEQGILKRPQTRLTPGYLFSLKYNSFEKKLGVATFDYRIHFALNCGARSCPAIAYYDPSAINEQLDLAARAYLVSATEYDKKEKIIYVPKIFLWYRADFGYEKGIRAILRRYEIVREGENPEINYREFDWTPAPARFR